MKVDPTLPEQRALLKAIAKECDQHQDFLSANIEHLVKAALHSAYDKGKRAASRRTLGLYLYKPKDKS